MKKLISFLLALLFCVSFVGCAKYSSSYHAVGFVHNNSSSSASMSFYEFEGTIVYRMSRKAGQDAKIYCQASLESGVLDVYCDSTGQKELLFSLTAGEERTLSAGEIAEGNFYILVETREKCRNGDLRFELRDKS